MGRISVIHTADLHLGSSFKGVPPQAGRQRRKDLMQTLTKIADACRQQQTDLLLISGDLWDEHYVTRPLVDFVADQFRRIPATRVVIAPGQADFNHEDSFYREYPWPDNVHIFHQSILSSIWLPHLNARIYGLAWTSPEPPGAVDWKQVAEGRDSGCQVIIIAYGNPETLNIPQAVLDVENLAYVALGGAHRHLAWSGKAADPGCPEPLGFSAHGQCGVLQGTIGTTAGSLEFVPVGSREFISVQVGTDNCANQEDVTAEVRKSLASRAPEKNIFHVKLTGNRPLGEWDLQSIRAMLDDALYVYIQDHTETSYDVKALATEHSRGVVGRYIAAVQEVKGSAEDVQKRALAYGLDALLSGRVAQW